MISSEEAIALYKKHGFKPQVGKVRPEGRTCCVLGIMAVDKGKFARNTMEAADVLGIGTNEAFDIASGFDDGIIGIRKKDLGDAYSQAYQIGVACQTLL